MPPHENTAPPPPGWIKMKDLAKAAGLPKSTILHYVNEGLLPEPVKTGPNVAFYNPASVERLAFIRRVQARHRLSLAGIKKLLAYRDRGKEITPLLELTEVIFGRSGGEKIGRKEFLRATGLEPGELDRSLKCRALLPLSPDSFDQEDLAIGKMLKNAMSFGLEPEEFEYYAQFGDRIVDREFDLRDKVTEGLNLEENAALTLQMTQAARSMRSYVIDRIFQRRVMATKSLEDRIRTGADRNEETGPEKKRRPYRKRPEG